MGRGDAKARKPGRPTPAGFAVVDEGGRAVAVLPSEELALKEAGSLFPGLAPADAKRRIVRLRNRWGASRFFDEQARRGGAPSHVMALLTFYCGVATARGFDLERGLAFPIVGEGAGRSEARGRRPHNGGARRKNK